MNLVRDLWNRNKNEEQVYEDVTFEDAVESLHELDGHKRTEIILEKEHASLIISGGNQGLYIVNYFDQEDNPFGLTRISNESGEVKLVCGGQSAIFDIKDCFEIDFVINIIKDFFQEENILIKYHWKAN